MKHIRTDRFKKAFKDLPEEVKEQARKAFRYFQENSLHPGLRIERIRGHKRAWSGRITRGYRWSFHYEKDPETRERICVHRYIGQHDDVYNNP